MGHSVHFIKDLGSGNEGEGGEKFKIRPAPGGRHSSYATADE